MSFRRFAWVWLIALTGALPVAGHAQSTDSGGMRLVFGAFLELESQSNASLDAVESVQSDAARLGLSVGFRSETRQKHLALDASVKLAQGDDAATAGGLMRPAVSFSYRRQSVDARLSFDAYLREMPVNQASNRDVASGTATQRDQGARITIEWNSTRRVGFGVSLGRDRTTFDGGTATTLGGAAATGSSTQKVQGFARIDLAKTVQWVQTLEYGRHQQDGVANRIIWDTASRLEIAMPRGAGFATIGYADVDKGTRLRAAMGTERLTRNGGFKGQIGAVKGITGKTHLTGALAVTRKGKDATLDLRLARVLEDSRLADAERMTTAFGLRVQSRAFAQADITVAVDWIRAGETGSDVSRTAGVIAVSYNRDLTRDVTLDIGVRHRRLRDSVTGSAHSNEMFISLGRLVQTRF